MGLIILPSIIIIRGKDASSITFSKEQISSSLATQPQWKIPTPSSEEQQKLKEIFSSPFKFLGKGAQAFAFDNEKYVLKFFKMRRFTPSWLDYLCPHVVRRRFKNLNWVFNGYKIAYDEFRQETGLILIHLEKSDYLHQKVSLRDKNGKLYLIDLDTTEFVLQKKGESIFYYLESLHREGNKEAVEQGLAQLLHLVQNRIQRGYADRDSSIDRNYGFAEGRIIQFDVGRLYKGVKERELEKVQNRLARWKQEHPY